jgi:predicted transcriptional regulator
MFIKNVLDNGESYWSIYKMIQHSYMLKLEKIECYKKLMQKNGN